MGKNDVFFLPYLMGERSPHNDVTARGAFIGMRADTTRGEMTLAMLEGVAFALRDCLEAAKKNGVQIPRTKLCGGGARSPLWRKIIANVMDMPERDGAARSRNLCGIRTKVPPLHQTLSRPQRPVLRSSGKAKCSCISLCDAHKTTNGRPFPIGVRSFLFSDNAPAAAIAAAGAFLAL